MVVVSTTPSNLHEGNSYGKLGNDNFTVTGPDYLGIIIGRRTQSAGAHIGHDATKFAAGLEFHVAARFDRSQRLASQLPTSRMPQIPSFFSPHDRDLHQLVIEYSSTLMATAYPFTENW